MIKRRLRVFHLTHTPPSPGRLPVEVSSLQTPLPSTQTSLEKFWPLMSRLLSNAPENTSGNPVTLALLLCHELRTTGGNVLKSGLAGVGGCTLEVPAAHGL